MNSPGQHHPYSIGGDKDSSPGMNDVAGGSAFGFSFGGVVDVAVALREDLA